MTREADPMLKAIAEYLKADAGYSRICISENEAAMDAFYDAHLLPIRERLRKREVPIASIAGVRESIRTVLLENLMGDTMERGMLRASLDFLDGKASAEADPLLVLIQAYREQMAARRQTG